MRTDLSDRLFTEAERRADAEAAARIEREHETLARFGFSVAPQSVEYALLRAAAVMFLGIALMVARYLMVTL